MKDFIKIFTNLRLFEIFILNIFGGMPMGILLTTISIWLTEVGIPIEIITTFALARLPYSLKFLWSPFIDFIPIPFLNKLGHRKSRLMLCALLIIIVLFSLSFINPAQSLSSLYIATFILSFISATMDINQDAFRIETLEPELLGIGAANSVLGYRIGMLVFGPIALGIADYMNSWEKTLTILSFIYSFSIVIILFTKEPQVERSNKKFTLLEFKKVTIATFKDFLNKDLAIVTLLAIILFKLGESMLHVVVNPFYLKLGFTKTEISLIAKFYGFIATIAGSYIGGIIVFRIGALKTTIWGGVAQSIVHVLFIWLHHQGPSISSLYIVITIENLAIGVAGSAFIAYMSQLCSKQYSATQYALLSSAACLCNNTLTCFGGTLTNLMGWDLYFAFTILLGIPGILILLYINRLHKKLQIN